VGHRVFSLVRHWIPHDRAHECGLAGHAKSIRCGCAAHFHIFGFLYSISSKHRHSGDYDAMGRIGPPSTERCNTCIPPVANAVFYIKHRLTAETRLCLLFQSHALYFIQSTPRPSPSGRAIRPRCLPHLPQVLARPSKSRALARRRTPQQRRGRPNDHRYAPPHSHLSSRPSQNSH
jgi:hypothetical protein